MALEPITPLPLRRYQDQHAPPAKASPRSRAVALALSLVTGWFGGHRFYVGKPGTGILQLLTLGGCGIWTLYDIILIGAGAFRDGDDRRLANWAEEDVSAARPGLDDRQVALILEEMELTRGDMADLAERVDFVERMLARERSRDQLPEG